MSALLDGIRVLVVEDEFLVALDLEAMIRDLGGTVVGPVAHLDAARTAMLQEKINCAILDVRLDGHTSLPLADELIASGFPVILASGYGSDQLPSRFADTPKLRKPFSVHELARVLERIFQQGSSPTSGQGQSRH
jgi:DNA-binding NtrC family response regulator